MKTEGHAFQIITVLERFELDCAGINRAGLCVSCLAFLIRRIGFKVPCISTAGCNRCTVCSVQGIAVTGSALDSFDSVPWIVRLREELAAASQRRQRLLGICFGCQAMAISLGGNAGGLVPSSLFPLSMMHALVFCVPEKVRPCHAKLPKLSGVEDPVTCSMQQIRL